MTGAMPATMAIRVGVDRLSTYTEYLHGLPVAASHSCAQHLGLTLPDAFYLDDTNHRLSVLLHHACWDESPKASTTCQRLGAFFIVSRRASLCAF